MFTPEEMRQIEKADGQRGWVPIPDGCPPEARARIVEYRAKALGIVKDPAVEQMKAQLDASKSL